MCSYEIERRTVLEARYTSCIAKDPYTCCDKIIKSKQKVSHKVCTSTIDNGINHTDSVHSYLTRVCSVYEQGSGSSRVCGECYISKYKDFKGA